MEFIIAGVVIAVIFCLLLSLFSPVDKDDDKS